MAVPTHEPSPAETRAYLAAEHDYDRRRKELRDAFDGRLEARDDLGPLDAEAA